MISAKVFLGSIQKFGNGEDENEDALAFHQTWHKQRLAKLRFAIADGATQSSFSQLWANLLVSDPIIRIFTPSINKTGLLISNSYTKWNSEIEKIELPWFAKEKASKGAFSSFLWMSINFYDQNKYANLTAIGIGDCELLIVRDNKVINAFPIESSNEFNSCPVLISSKIEKNYDLKPKFLRTKLFPGDDIILASDALAKYLLSEFETGTNPLITLYPSVFAEADQKARFQKWIECKRRERLLKNDDSTMIRIEIFDNENAMVSK